MSSEKRLSSSSSFIRASCNMDQFLSEMNKYHTKSRLRHLILKELFKCDPRVSVIIKKGRYLIHIRPVFCMETYSRQVIIFALKFPWVTEEDKWYRMHFQFPFPSGFYCICDLGIKTGIVYDKYSCMITYMFIKKKVYSESVAMVPSTIFPNLDLWLRNYHLGEQRKPCIAESKFEIDWICQLCKRDAVMDLKGYRCKAYNIFICQRCIIISICYRCDDLIRYCKQCAPRGTVADLSVCAHCYDNRTAHQARTAYLIELKFR